MESVVEFFSASLDRLVREAQEQSGLEHTVLFSALAQAVTEKRWRQGMPVKMREIQREAAAAALRANDGDRSRTAAELGIGRRQLDYRLMAAVTCAAAGCSS